MARFGFHVGWIAKFRGAFGYSLPGRSVEQSASGMVSIGRDEAKPQDFEGHIGYSGLWLIRTSYHARGSNAIFLLNFARLPKLQ
jgi:hypothetical protein